MKRMSRRETTFRCAMSLPGTAVVDRIQRGQAVVRVDGINCCLDIPQDARYDLSATGWRAGITSWPERQGDGMLPAGFRPEDDGLDWLRARNRHVRGRLMPARSAEDAAVASYRRYAERHRVGDLVEAEVLRVRRDKIRLCLADGVHATLPIGDYVDRLPGWTRANLARWPVPGRMEVILRRIDPEWQVIAVSCHGYPQDPAYCNAAAGYRASYDAAGGWFRNLPWERPPRGSEA